MLSISTSTLEDQVGTCWVFY